MRMYRVHPAELDRRPVIMPHRRLTPDEQLELRTLRASGWKVPALMVRFDVSRRTAYRYMEGDFAEGRVGDFVALFWLRPGHQPERIEPWRRVAAA